MLSEIARRNPTPSPSYSANRESQVLEFWLNNIILFYLRKFLIPGILHSMNEVIIFSDGASRGNPGPGGWGTIVVYDSNLMSKKLNLKSEGDAKGAMVKELGGRETHTTNNRMELTAALEGLQLLQQKEIKNVLVTIYTDSSYTINGITKWVYGWQKNGWRTKEKKEVLNKGLWEALLGAASCYEVEWKLLPGHAGIPANERCDEIATTYADGKKPTLFSGPKKDYRVSLSIQIDAQKMQDKNRQRAKAYSYVSLVDGVVKTHKTWADCEARVKGKSAKFKKVLSADEETRLIAEWIRNLPPSA